MFNSVSSTLLSQLLFMFYKGASDIARRGIDLLKRMSREPWWNKKADLCVTDAVAQLIALLPRASGKVNDSLHGYLHEIHRY